MNKLRGSLFFMYIVVTVLLAVTTFLSARVYGSWWFVALWAVFAALLTTALAVFKMWKHCGSFILHLSFLAILGGGLLTWLTQESGTVKIHPGETVDSFSGEDGQKHKLPHKLTLKKFEVKYYPGGNIPQDYISQLISEGKEFTVSMNNIHDFEGYRLLQSSYDSNGATVLSVNHDPYGIPLSYTGYALFSLGGLLMLLSPRGRFRQLLKGLGVIIFLIIASPLANATTIEGISKESADSLRSREVIYNGKRVCFNTLARDVVRKIHGKPSYRGLTAEQTLISMRLFPDAWKTQPLILIKDKSVAKELGISGKYASLTNLFDETGNYRVERLYSTVDQKHLRGVEELDEKVGLILQLYSGDLIVNPPADSTPLSKTHISLELFYNSFPFSMLIFILLFMGFFAGMGEYFNIKSGLRIAKIMLVAAIILSIGCFVLQWYLTGRIPLANTFETMELVIIVVELLILIAGYRQRIVIPLGMLLTGALALVAHLIKSNPIVTPLMPVLHSGWLSLHVSLVMTAYSILGFTFVTSLGSLLKSSVALQLNRLSIALLYPGVWLMGLGIFTGAVWANVSWGQYWSWDPKETWALITMLVYAFPLHGRFNRLFVKGNPFGGKRLSIYLCIASLSIVMTYFGVNYLDSLHAYN
ncbi:MAG: cytochrome c biogenesis protein CcsA [Prevotella sp.]|nr:cytochrome c biogenesis protein CcsA [Bacteroides sp.]MCM1367132.1 cytochrome c biogenesis protein CcsA [Prevotella sp.]MCM1437434.1 cytochrome c biogenesis protein CcsA [Prevotella sp.]